jgi:Kae1-associated kinase Bud32
MKEIAIGAEASIFEDNDRIIKKRLPKSYRHPLLDEKLRKQRTRREAKIIDKIQLSAPKLLQTDNKESIIMQKIDGDKLRDRLEENPLLGRQIGLMTAKMHDQGIIHGDLTTSNMLLKGTDLTFIDFGLSFESEKIEDKAVDLHLFTEALESQHFTVKDQVLEAFKEGYSQSEKSRQVFEKLREVQLRGRYKKQ